MKVKTGPLVCGYAKDNHSWLLPRLRMKSAWLTFSYVNFLFPLIRIKKVRYVHVLPSDRIYPVLIHHSHKFHPVKNHLI